MEKLTIKIPSGDICMGCQFNPNDNGFCTLYKVELLFTERSQLDIKCDACKKQKPIEVVYEQ